MYNVSWWTEQELHANDQNVKGREYREMSKRDFVKRLKVWAVMHDVSMTQLAERCQMAPSSLSRMMTEPSMPTLGTLRVLSDQTGIPVSEMVAMLLDSAPKEVNESEQDFVNLMLSLTEKQKAAVLALIDSFTGYKGEAEDEG